MTEIEKDMTILPVKKRNAFGRSFALFLMCLSGMGLVFFLGFEVGDRMKSKSIGAAGSSASASIVSSTKFTSISPSETTSFVSESIPFQSNFENKKKKYDLNIHWAGDAEVDYQNDDDKFYDACELLSTCFDMYAPDPINYPDNPYQYCQNFLKTELQECDHGFYFDGSRLVGFITGLTAHGLESTFAQMSLYNVCVRAEDRGTGISKTMVPEFIDQVVLKRVPNSIQRTYVGLSVDFSTEYSEASFKSYSKLGFNRWWEICSGMHTFDFNKVELQYLQSNPDDDTETPAAFEFPMSQFFLRRAEALKDSNFIDLEGNAKHHLCMVMLHGADDFNSIGRDIKMAVQKQLEA